MASSGDTNPWRDIGHAKWHDPYAAIEDTTGSVFKEAVKTEDQIWNARIKSLKSEIKSWESDFEKFQIAAWPESPEFAQVRYSWNGFEIAIQNALAGFTKNVWILDCSGKSIWSKKGITDFGVVPESDLMFLMEDIGSGAEHLELRVFSFHPNKSPKLLWKRDPVGPAILIRDQTLLYLGVENALRYHQIRSADLRTGKHDRVLFTETDKRVQVNIENRDGQIFVVLANALFQRLGVLGKSRVKWITNTIKSSIVPISKDCYATDHALHFITGKTVSLPAGEHIVDALLGPKDSMFVTTVREGFTSIWFFFNNGWTQLYKPTELCDIAICHENTTFPTFFLHRPSSPETFIEFRDFVGLVAKFRYPTPLPLNTLLTGTAKHEDGTRVPYAVVSHVKQPTKLIVDAYGAYGISSKRSYPIRWLSWLKRGYAFAYVCPRGGREDGDAWYDGARTALRKHHTFEDTAAGIAEIQRKLHISPKRTVFFGRSAGGWLAARIAQDYGHLVASVYAEVPYVDVLRTTTNPDLPLTQLEYDEFGDPRGKPEEYKALKKISPIDTVTAVENEPTLVVRTALHDMQVLPYEALKWSKKLRDNGWKKVYVGIDHEGGHFAGIKSMNRQRAEDAAILDHETERRTSRRRSTRRSGVRSTAGRGRTRRLTSS